MLNEINNANKSVNMVDIHSHFIYNVDDGAASIKESRQMVSQAKEIGVESIIATPHFHQLLYNSPDINKNFNELCDGGEYLGVNLFQGFEVFLTEHTLDDIKGNGALTLNNSRYILFELPFNDVPDYTEKVIKSLNFNNFTPLLAHPERNRRYIRNFNLFISVIEQGCLVQVDAASIIGLYGNDIKNFARKLIRLNLVYCIASNAHCADDYVKWYLPAYRQVEAWTDQKIARKLFYENPKVAVS